MGIVIQFLWIPNRFLSHFIRSVACLGLFYRFLFQPLPFLSSLYLPLCLVLSLSPQSLSHEFFGQSGACCAHRKQEEERTQVKGKGGSCRELDLRLEEDPCHSKNLRWKCLWKIVFLYFIVKCRRKTHFCFISFSTLFEFLSFWNYPFFFFFYSHLL